MSNANMIDLARTLGARAGAAIARDMLAEGEPIGTLTEDDLNGDDTAEICSHGVVCGSPEWNAFVDAAKAAYRATASV